MNSAPSRSAPAWAFAFAAVAYSLFIYALLPSQIAPLDDDFGYLKSIVQTLQHGRPWTDDFLEPWNAASSSISAAAFALTGNFYFATYGLQAIFAGGAMWVLCALLATRGFSTRTTITLAMLVLTFPVMLCRALEYTGMILYVPCLITAIWAAERQRWSIFALAWLLAATNRQSAVAWLVLPAYAAARSYLARPKLPLVADYPSIKDAVHAGAAERKRDLTVMWRPLAVILGGVAVLGLMHAVMNPTDSQRLLLYQTIERFHAATAVRAIATGAIVFFVAVGFSAALQTLSRNPPASRLAWRGAALGAMVVLAISLLLVDERYLANPDHIDIRWRAGWAYSKLIVGLGLAGWIGFRFSMLPALALCAAASVIMTSLRANLGDYYFIDAALFGFFAVVPVRAEGIVPDNAKALLFRYWKPGLTTGLTLAGVFQLQSALHLKILMGESHAVAVLYEGALRAGRLRAHEIGDAPFGYSGWHLYSHAISLRTTTNPQVRWFSRLLTAPVKSVELAAAYPAAFPKRWQGHAGNPPDPQITPLAETTVRLGWFWECRYVLQRRAPPLEPDPLGPDFKPIKYPQNNAEWREFIAGPPLR